MTKLWFEHTCMIQVDILQIQKYRAGIAHTHTHTHTHTQTNKQTHTHTHTHTQADLQMLVTCFSMDRLLVSVTPRFFACKENRISVGLGERFCSRQWADRGIRRTGRYYHRYDHWRATTCCVSFFDKQQRLPHVSRNQAYSPLTDSCDWDSLQLSTR